MSEDKILQLSVIKNQEYKCPKCQRVQESMLILKDDEGGPQRYCISCLIKLLSRHMPQMEEVTDEEQNDSKG